MKAKRIFSLVLTVIMVLSAFQVFTAFAANPYLATNSATKTGLVVASSSQYRTDKANSVTTAYESGVYYQRIYPDKAAFVSGNKMITLDSHFTETMFTDGKAYLKFAYRSTQAIAPKVNILSYKATSDATAGGGPTNLTAPAPEANKWTEATIEISSTGYSFAQFHFKPWGDTSVYGDDIAQNGTDYIDYAGWAIFATKEDADAYSLLDPQFIGSERIMAEDDTTVRAVLHDWKTTPDDTGLTKVSNQFFTEASNPRPKFATWTAAAPSMDNGQFKITTVANAGTMFEVDGLSSKTATLKVPSNLKTLKIRFKTTETLTDSKNLNLVMNRSNAALKDGTTTAEQVRPSLSAAFTASGDWQEVTFNLASKWKEMAGTTDVTELVASPYTTGDMNQYRLDFPAGIGDFYIDYVAFFASEEEASLFNYETRTFTVPERAEKPTGIVGVNTTGTDASDGKITGVDATMEYSADDGETWTAVVGTEITGLTAGTYLIRVAKNGDVFASLPVTIEVSDTVEGELPYLHNTFKKLASGESVKIGYFGGSVTVGSGLEADKPQDTYSWRGLTGTWFKTQYPSATIELRHAAIGGTGSRFGSFRTNTDGTGLGLNEKPCDLVFVEFAINDNYESRATEPDAVKSDMEVIFNKVWTANPNADIIVLLTTDSGKNGNEYATSTAHREIAEQYGIKVIDIGRHIWAKIRETNGLAADAAIPSNIWSTYFSDIVHPLAAGYQIYADYIIEYLAAQKQASQATLTAAYEPHTVESTVNINREFLENANIKNFATLAKTQGFTGSGSLSASFENSAVSFKFTGVNAYLWTSKNGINGVYNVYVDGVDSGYSVDMWRNSTGGQQHAIPVFAADKPYGTYTVTLVLKAHPEHEGISNYFRGIAVYSDAEHTLNLADTGSFIEFVDTDREALSLPEIAYTYDPIVVPASFYKKQYTSWNGSVGTNAGAVTYVDATKDSKACVAFTPVATSRPADSLQTPDKSNVVTVDGYSFNAYKVTPYNYKYAEIEYYYELPAGVDTPSGKLPTFRVALPKSMAFNPVDPTVKTNEWATAGYDFSENATWNGADFARDTQITHTNLFPFGSSTKGEAFLANDEYTGEKIYISKITFMTEAPKAPAQKPTGLVGVATTGDTATGKITGVDDTMEYSADNGETWTSVTVGATEIAGLAAGAYLVRVKAAGDFAASESVGVVVESGADADVVEYITERYPDADKVYYVSPKGLDSNGGLTPATAKLTIPNAISTLKANGEGDYVIVLIDEASLTGNLSFAGVEGTVTFTTACGEKVHIPSSFSIVKGAVCEIIFDEIPAILGNPLYPATNKKQSWISINGEINLNTNGNTVTVKDGFVIAEMGFSAAYNVEADGSQTPCEPVRRTAGIGLHTTYESEKNVTVPGNTLNVNGGKWSYVRATGYQAGEITGDINVYIGGGVTTSLFLGGHGPNAINKGNIYGTISGGTITNAFTGGNDGKITGNSYLNMTSGTVTKLNIGGNSANAKVSGDSIVSISGGTVTNIYDKGNVEGKTVLFLNNGYTPDATIPSTIDYVIKAPEKVNGTVEIVLNDDGTFKGIKAVPANDEDSVLVNGTAAVADSDEVYTLDLGVSTIKFAGEDISFKTPADSLGKYDLALTDVDAEKTNELITNNPTVPSKTKTPVYARTITFVDAETREPTNLESGEKVYLKIPKSIVGTNAGKYEFLRFNAGGTYINRELLAESADYYYIKCDSSCTILLYECGTSLAARYIFNGKYNPDEAALIYDINLFAANANTAGIGFEITGNSDIEISDFDYADGIASLSGYGITADITGSHVIDAWSPTATANIDSMASPKKIASFKLNMTPEQFRTFISDSVNDVDLDDPVEYIYKDACWQFSQHIPNSTQILTFSLYTSENDIDYGVTVTASGVDNSVTTLDYETTHTMFNKYTFTASHTVGMEPEVTYKIGVNGTPTIITPVENVYTIPADVICGDITIEFTYGELIENIAITGIDVPAPNGTPDTTAVAETDANYTIESVEWSPAVTKYDYNTEYTVKVTIEANEDYAVSSATNVTINGNIATVNNLGGGVIEATYKYTTVDRTPITSVAITGIDVPTPGATPDTTAVAEASANYTIESTVWTPTVTKYDYNTEYTVTVTVAPSEGYTVSADTTATIGGNAATVAAIAEGKITVSYKYTTADRTPITSVAITGIDVPTPGATPDTTATAEASANYTIESTVWTPTVTKYDYNTEYTVTVTVAPSEGYTVSADTTATIGGNTATVAAIAEGKITVSYKYTTTDRTPITSVAITGIDVPTPGATPDTTAVAETSANYTIESTVWTPTVTKYDYNTEYTVTVTVAPNEGYTVSADTTATIGGNTATVAAIAEGKITVSYKYTTTDRTPITSVAITGIDVPTPGATPDTTAVAETSANYTIESTVWTPTVTKYDYNTEYTVTVTVAPNEGYTVSADTTATIGGNTATVAAIAEGKITVSYKYTTPDRADVPNLELVIESPAATATPSTATVKLPEGITETPFTVKSVTWKDSDNNTLVTTDKFGFEKVYKADIVVNVADGNKVPDSFVITIAGQNIVKPNWTFDLATGDISFTVTFPATGKNKAAVNASFKLLRDKEDAPVSYAEIKFYNEANALVKTEVIETVSTRTSDTYVVTVPTITVDFAPGTYSAVISKNGYLDFTITGITIAQMTDVDTYTEASFMAELVAGDITNGTANDGKVDLDDFIRVTRAFADSTEFEATTYDTLSKAVDIDEDGAVTIFDLGYVINNFGKNASESTMAATIE